MKKYYLVGNRVFETWIAASEYCEQCDFDGETMITELQDGERMADYYDKSINYNIGYTDASANLETVYKIEYITDKRDFEQVCSGKHNAPWELYKVYKTESLEQAMTAFLAHYASASTYDAKLFEEISINGELIREQCITDIRNFSRICDRNEKRLADILISRDETISAMEEEINTIKNGFSKFGDGAYNKFIREQREKSA